ncbi:hypothetical protein [Singulisphaera sp. PoT]|uniref:hypothetical protein n=1 Tax=Singulisphaera sp. PoT TaxID=3411797 RepID=UPI003BF5EBBD
METGTTRAMRTSRLILHRSLSALHLGATEERQTLLDAGQEPTDGDASKRFSAAIEDHRSKDNWVDPMCGGQGTEIGRIFGRMRHGRHNQVPHPHALQSRKTV